MIGGPWLCATQCASPSSSFSPIWRRSFNMINCIADFDGFQHWHRLCHGHVFVDANRGCLLGVHCPLDPWRTRVERVHQLHHLRLGQIVSMELRVNIYFHYSVNDRLACFCSLVGLMVFHVVTYSWPFLPQKVHIYEGNGVVCILQTYT